MSRLREEHLTAMSPLARRASDGDEPLARRASGTVPLMARIAEDLLLLLLDNASGRPALGHSRREKLLGAAVLLDLALACRVWLSYDGAPAPAGRLLPSGEPDLADPILDPPLRMMHQHVWRPRTAVAKLSRGVEPALLGRLEQGGHIRPVPMQGQPLTGSVIWPMVDRTRVDEVRAGLVSRCST
ncbi:MAG: hypothetical protein QOH60_263 [Mycobacterium sp.]|jgi:hypothetical protein|nr:hypothetical protein [Mycobacterium sp.]